MILGAVLAGLINSKYIVAVVKNGNVSSSYISDSIIRTLVSIRPKTFNYFLDV